MFLRGTTNSLGLDEVITLIALGGLEGTLTVTCPEGTLEIPLHEGHIVAPTEEADALCRRIEQAVDSVGQRYSFRRHAVGEGERIDPRPLFVDVARRKDETRRLRRRQVLRAEVGPATEPMLQGELEGIGLPTLLQALRDRRHTGTLSVREGEREQRLYFKCGEAYVLRDMGGDDEFALDFLGEQAASVGELASSADAWLDEEELTQEGQRAARDQFLEVIFWEEARFSFREGELPAAFHRPPRGLARIALRTHLFLLQAVQRLDAWSALRRAMRGGHSVFRFVSPGRKLEAIRAGVDAELLTLVDGRLSFDDLVRISGVPRLQAARTVVSLFRSGALVRRVDRMADRRRTAG